MWKRGNLFGLYASRSMHTEKSQGRCRWEENAASSGARLDCLIQYTPFRCSLFLYAAVGCLQLRPCRLIMMHDWDRGHVGTMLVSAFWHAINSHRDFGVTSLSHPQTSTPSPPKWPPLEFLRPRIVCIKYLVSKNGVFRSNQLHIALFGGVIRQCLCLSPYIKEPVLV